MASGSVAYMIRYDISALSILSDRPLLAVSGVLIALQSVSSSASTLSPSLRQFRGVDRFGYSPGTYSRAQDLARKGPVRLDADSSASRAEDI